MGREMNHCVNLILFDSMANGRLVVQIRLNQQTCSRSPSVARRQIVEDESFMAGVLHESNGVTANISGSTGNKDVQTVPFREK